MNNPPKPDEFEISVIGPGYGECIILHIGLNQWIVVDSCIQSPSKQSAAIDYLQNIDVDYSNAVRLIVASHWDDDHIRGMGKLFKSCKNATFICSEALKSKEFLKLIHLYNKKWDMKETSGVKEFGEIIKEHESRCKKKENSRENFKFAISDRPIWSQSYKINGEDTNCTIYSLSPNDEMVLQAKNELLRIIPHENEKPKTIPPRIKRNKTSIVLWIVINKLKILFGADLEEQKNGRSGWSAIVKSDLKPSGKAFFFKIPHHGSMNGFNSTVWEKMLEPEPLSVLTSFNNGSVKLPTPKGITTLCSLTPNLYSTSNQNKKRIKRQNKTVDKTIKETVGKNIFLKNASFGQVRFRFGFDAKGDVELFKDAGPLCKKMGYGNDSYK